MPGAGYLTLTIVVIPGWTVQMYLKLPAFLNVTVFEPVFWSLTLTCGPTSVWPPVLPPSAQTKRILSRLWIVIRLGENFMPLSFIVLVVDASAVAPIPTGTATAASAAAAIAVRVLSLGWGNGGFLPWWTRPPEGDDHSVRPSGSRPLRDLGPMARGPFGPYLPLVGSLRRLAGSPVLHFALSGLLSLAVVGLVAVRLVEDNSRREALRFASSITQLAGEGIVAPQLQAAVLRGERPARAGFDRVVRERLLYEPIERIEIRRADGRVIYSDDPALIGTRRALNGPERRSLRDRTARAGASDTSTPGSRASGGGGRAREVAIGVRPAAGGPAVLFAEYLDGDTVAAYGSRIWREFAPILLGALLLLELLQLPLARSLARRLRRGQREREDLLVRAVTASETERRHIARDLHDGVVQELAGVSYALSASTVEADPSAVSRTVRESGEQVRQSVRRLRSLLVDLYPESLQQLGLEGAMTDLLAGAQAQRLTTRLDFDPAVEVDAAREALVFRTTQEALRNVAAHAEAQSVRVSFGAVNGSAVLEVADDGRGLAAPEEDRPHFGLRMLDDLARECGGRLELLPGEEVGTTLRLTVPRR